MLALYRTSPREGGTEMPRIAYEEWNPGRPAQQVLAAADAICAEYTAQGYDLTLRQLYYQFVARDLIENTQRSYKRLGEIVNKGRLAGFLDWDYIVDRTRNLRSLAHWDSPAEIVEACARQFRFDKWDNQPTRIEVWVEKEALAGVVAKAAERQDVPWFSCRGYVSQSELWGAAQRLIGYEDDGQDVLILHLGDHDPSGIDMTRDIEDRLELFGCSATVRRIALNMDQVQRYNPPPNPAKLTDSRVGAYLRDYGHQSWELDALDPATMDELITSHIVEQRDDARWQQDTYREKNARGDLEAVAQDWDECVSAVRDVRPDDL
jgi:hypothetical protein